eukprot:UN23877
MVMLALQRNNMIEHELFENIRLLIHSWPERLDVPHESCNESNGYFHATSYVNLAVAFSRAKIKDEKLWKILFARLNSGPVSKRSWVRDSAACIWALTKLNADYLDYKDLVSLQTERFQRFPDKWGVGPLTNLLDAFGMNRECLKELKETHPLFHGDTDNIFDLLVSKGNTKFFTKLNAKQCALCLRGLSVIYPHFHTPDSYPTINYDKQLSQIHRFISFFIKHMLKPVDDPKYMMYMSTVLKSLSKLNISEGFDVLVPLFIERLDENNKFCNLRRVTDVIFATAKGCHRHIDITPLLEFCYQNFDKMHIDDLSRLAYSISVLNLECEPIGHM